MYLNIINTAKDYLYLTTPYLICDSEIINALKLCSKRGVDVRIIVPHVPDKKTVFLMTRSNYEPLIKAGVKIYEYTPGFIHAKNLVCDDTVAVCGTINLDYRSLVHHFECGVWMYKTKAISRMKTDFFNTLAISKEITETQARLKYSTNVLAKILKLFSPLF